MRTIDATLQTALVTKHFMPYIKLKVYRNGSYLTTLNVIKYKLTGTHLSVTVRGLVSISNSPEWIKLILVRGVTIEGTNYTLESSKFTPITGWIENLTTKNLYIQTSVEAELIPPKYVTFAGDASYTTVITSFCTAIGKTPVFKNSGAAYWGYQFMPTGTVIAINNAQSFLSLLWQKRLIFCCDNGNEQLLFYSAVDIPIGSFDASINPVIMNIGTGYFGQRLYVSTDENGTVRTAGTVGDPLFNLGFIKSTESLPTIYQQAQPLDFTNLINLNYQDGDFLGINGNTYAIYPAQVTETFNPKESPGWAINIKQTQYFTNTEGGTLPSDLVRSINYMPLNTSQFNGVLNAQASNVQSAMDILDDHHIYTLSFNLPLIIENWQTLPGSTVSPWSTDLGIGCSLPSLLLSRLDLSTGSTIGQVAAVYSDNILIGITPNISMFLNIAEVDTVLTDATVRLGLWLNGSTHTTTALPLLTATHIGFKIVNGEIWATVSDGVHGEYSSDTGIFYTGSWTSHKLFFSYQSGKIQFYVDGVLRYTHSVNLPSTSAALVYCGIINSIAAVRKIMLQTLLIHPA